MKIGVDIDGVLANFNEAFIERTIKVLGKNLFPCNADLSKFVIPTWDYHTHYGYTQEELRQVEENIHRDTSFWFTLKPYPETIMTVEKLNTWSRWGNNAVYFITARPGIKVKNQTEQWLSRMGMTLPTVLISDQKGAVASALRLNIYIDDRVENVVDVVKQSEGTTSILLDQGWNRTLPLNVYSYRVKRVNNLTEFIKGTEEILNGLD